MRDFSALYVRFGSKAENLGMSKCCPLYPRKRTSDLRVLMSTRPRRSSVPSEAEASSPDEP